MWEMIVISLRAVVSCGVDAVFLFSFFEFVSSALLLFVCCGVSVDQALLLIVNCVLGFPHASVSSVLLSSHV